MLISALEWRRHNGEITLETDSAGAEFFERAGLSGAWNAVNVILDCVPVNSTAFWAAGKLYALRAQKSPVCMIDTDFIVWREILFDNIKEPLAVIHEEPLSADIYPDLPEFRSADRGYDWSQKPVNTAFAYIADTDFIKYYTSAAIDFMENAPETDDRLTYMVFAEQRLFSMCAAKLGKSVYRFSDTERLFANGENYFTHLWGFKSQLRSDAALRADFCAKCMKRLEKDFPEYARAVRRIFSDGLKKTLL